MRHLGVARPAADEINVAICNRCGAEAPPGDSRRWLSGVDLTGATYTVTDSDGQVCLQEAVAVNADGSNRFQVPLPARRAGADRSGRVSTITITGDDLAGNVGR
jgi:hypothetical protein